MRAYEQEFKIEAVKLANEIGLSKTSRRLGVAVSTISGWKKKYTDNERTSESNNNVTYLSRKEKLEYERKIKELEKANSILKKAIGFLAESQKG